MDEHICNYELRDFWQQLIYDNHDTSRFKSQLHCGNTPLKIPGIQQGIVIVANDKQSKVWGVQHCKNAWVCPVCSAYVMSIYASNIAIAIDALEKQYNQCAFMVTLGIPHTYKMTCKQTYEILSQTWSYFIHHGNKKQKWQREPFNEFCAELNCTHRIRVCEFTWSPQNGWHPHFHCLFFVPKKNLQKVADWQERLSTRWNEFARKATLKVLSKDDRFNDPENYVEILYKRQELSDRPAFYISLNDDGTVRQSKSSMYICGWGADAELACQHRKQAQEGHFTPHELLKIAYETDDEQLKEKYCKLFRDYAFTTLTKRRMRMSQGLRQIIFNWKLTNDYVTLYKKKLAKNNAQSFRFIVWFTTEQWSDLLLLQKLNRQPLITTILKLARAPDAKKLIEDFVLNYGIDISNNLPYIHKGFIEKCFNKNRTA